jgi:hypothetical protein
MNERIKELAEQATTFEVICGRGFDTTQYTEHFSKEKFAELIVKECATLCINEGRAHDQWFGSHCAITVKEHFGVE